MSDRKPFAGSSAVPEPIVRKLRGVIRRVRLVTAARGVLAVAAVAVGSLLAAMGVQAALDAARSELIFSAWPRWALMALTALATVGAAYWLLLRPLARTFTLAGIARVVEKRHPELQERISSAVELIASGEAEEFRGSNELIGVLVEEAALEVHKVLPKREVRFRAVRPFLIAAAATVLVLGALLAIWPSEASLLLARTVVPFSNLGNALEGDLSISPGDVVLQHGQSLRIEATVRHGSVTSADLLVAGAKGGEVRNPMRYLGPLDDGQRQHLEFTIPAVTEGFRYRVYAGGALSRYYRVKVVPRPEVRAVSVRYEYPDYTRLPPDVEENGVGDIRAVAGTVATVTAATNKTMRGAKFLLDGKPAKDIPTELVPSGDGTTSCVFRVPLRAELNAQWSILLHDGDDKTNVSESAAIEALSDAKPTARVILPAATDAAGKQLSSDPRRLKMKPDDKLAFGYELTDDFGVSEASLLVSVDGRKQPDRPLDLSAAKGGATRLVGAAALDLGDLDLSGARTVTFQLRARDRLPAPQGPQEALSEQYTIDLDVKAISRAESVLLAQELHIRQELERILAELTDVKKDTSEVRRLAEQVTGKYEAAQKADDKGLMAKLSAASTKAATAIAGRIDGITTRLRATTSRTRDLAAFVTEGTYAGMAPRLTDLADNHIAKAETLAVQLKLAEDVKARGAYADESDFQVDRSIAIVKELLQDFDGMTELVRKALKFEELSDTQKDLAEMVREAATAPAEFDLEKWRKEQQEVAKDLAGEMRKDPQAAAEQFKKDSEKAKDLAAEAAKLAEKQAETMEQTKKLEELKKIDEELKDVAKRQKELSEKAAAQPKTAEQARPMASAAKDIEAGRLPEAVEKQVGAEKALDQSGQKPMAQEQADLRKETAELMAKRGELAEALRQEQLARLAAEQKSLASEIGRLSDQVKSKSPQEDRSDTQAARAATEAAEQLAKAEVPQAAQSAQQASKNMQQLAKNLAQQAAQQAPAQPQGEPPAGENPTPEQLAQKAGDLSEKQEKLAEKIDQLAKKDAAELVAAEQAQLAQEAAELAADAALVSQHGQDMGLTPEAQKQAQQAAGQAAEAKQSAASAAEQMKGEAKGQPSPPPAPGQPMAAQPQPGTPGPPSEPGPGPGQPMPGPTGAQQAAAQKLQETSKSLQELGKMLAQAAENAPEGSPDAPALAEAFENAEQAAESGSPSAAQQAAAMLAALAASAAQQAQAAGTNPFGLPGEGMPMPMMGTGDGGTKMQPTILSRAELQKMGISTVDWTLLKGELKDEILQAAAESGPKEYRRYVREYFRILSKKAAQQPEKAPK
ncbi:MAG TPA: hypothetical protein PK082_00540 [Phycisphaerae bacterium]|nr:hypothetical protein [Phycisphaerae bacterium]